MMTPFTTTAEFTRGEPFGYPSVRIASMSLDLFEDEIGEDIDDYHLSSFTDRPIRSVETELGKAKIASRRGLFFMMCHGDRYVTVVIPPSDDGPDRYDAVRTIGLAVEVAFDEAQECTENNRKTKPDPSPDQG